MSTMSIRLPTIYVIAGPNGAGKTTFASEFLPEFVDCREFLNADLIAALTVEDFLDLLGELGIPAVDYPPEDLDRELGDNP